MDVDGDPSTTITNPGEAFFRPPPSCRGTPVKDESNGYSDSYVTAGLVRISRTDASAATRAAAILK